MLLCDINQILSQSCPDPNSGIPHLLRQELPTPHPGRMPPPFLLIVSMCSIHSPTLYSLTSIRPVPLSQPAAETVTSCSCSGWSQAPSWLSPLHTSC